ncbi:MAG: ribose-phosphate pyrophosphokinase [Bacteroidales bacterium]|nr:ribose-phosphate pyrophosphokinase [Bacteroidales bacterium]
MEKHPIKIFTGTATNYLTQKIVHHFGVDLGKTSVERFSDGEFEPRFDDSVRGCDVYIVQSTFAPSDNFLELLLMIDAAKRASAWQVNAVIPYFGFARQDRKSKSRVSIGAKLMANLLSAAGVDRVITMDLHAGQIQGFFDVPVDHLYASSIFVPYLRNLHVPDLLIAAPDMGGTKRAKAYAKFLDADIAICHKTRTAANVVDSMEIIGNVEGKNVIIVDDMIDTAGTITMAADLVMGKGAKSVRAIATHAVCSGPAFERINNSAIDELIITDTIYHKEIPEKIKILSCAEFLADSIKKVYENDSISSNFIVIE